MPAPGPGGRHRGGHQHPVEAALTGFWTFGRLAAGLVLGATAWQQLEPEQVSSARSSMLADTQGGQHSGHHK